MMKKVMLALCVAVGVFAGSKEVAFEAATRGYETKFIDLVEWIYGKGFLSQGGEPSIEKMVAPLDLEGKKVLDIGSGIGGSALTLAKNHTVEMVGIEPQEAMVAKANAYFEEVQNELKGNVKFIVMEDPSNLQLFEDNTFDYIISKEVLLHVPLNLKESFFAEIFRTLKPGGEIAIIDWTHKDGDYSDSTKKMIALDGVAYNMIAPIEYLTLLSKAGFKSISLEDTTNETIDHTTQNLTNIRMLYDKITEQYDEETYNFCVQSWSLQKKAFQNGELSTGIFRAKKTIL